MKWKSLIQTDPSVSFLSGRHGTLHKHHVLHGTANRKKAEEDGLYVMLTVDEHQRLHDQGEYDNELKQIAEREWIKHYGSVEQFIKRYGRNYLYDEY